MPVRTLLQNQLYRAWKKTILDSYDHRLINSEGGLQVNFCLALCNEFERDRVKRYIFVEPIIISGSLQCYPDLLICNAKSVIGVVELKYTPRGIPRTKKDLNTLSHLRGSADDILVENLRYRGNQRPRRFTLSSDAVFCWAAIYAGKKVLALPDPENMNGHFLWLHALTQHNSKASVISQPKIRNRNAA